jgi:RNA polymerase primary sigma factor
VEEQPPELPALGEEDIGRLAAELGAEGIWVDDPVKAYLKEIGSVPLLDAQEETALAAAARAGDAEAKPAASPRPTCAWWCPSPSAMRAAACRFSI